MTLSRPSKTSSPSVYFPTRVVAMALLAATLLAPMVLGQSGVERGSTVWQVVAPEGHQLALPFSPGVKAGDFLYLSGAIGNLPGTTDVPGGIGEQTRRTLENLAAVLEVAEIDPSRVVEARIYLADAALRGPVMKVYRDVFPGSGPATVVVEADIAIRNGLAEIGLTAALPGVTVQSIVPQGWIEDPRGSWAVKAGNTVFTAGLGTDDPAHLDDPGSAGAQVGRAMERLGEVLAAAGMGYQDLASCKVFLADGRDYEALNTVYPTFFEGFAAPARATVRARLGPGRLAEVACTAVRGDRRAVLPPGATARPILSPAIAVGERLFLSGMVGRDAEGTFPPDVGQQTTLVLDNLEATLNAAGLSFDDVVSAEVFLSDVRYYAAMNAIYGERLGRPAPARATVGSPLMTPAAWVEIQMLAQDPGDAGGRPAAPVE